MCHFAECADICLPPKASQKLLGSLWLGCFCTHSYSMGISSSSWVSSPCRHLTPNDCHELAFFTFFSLLFYCIDTCHYSPKSWSSTNSHSLLSISPSNFVSDHQRKSNSACIQSHNVANTTLELQRTARFKTKRNNKAI